MSADLHIHIYEGITEDDLANFFSNSFGSKWFNPRNVGSKLDDGYEAISNTPNIWVGEVSWLKAAVFESPGDFVPDPIAKISEIITDELPTIDDKLIAKVEVAMGLSNETGYSLGSQNDVIDFLKLHKGKRCFTVSW